MSYGKHRGTTLVAVFLMLAIASSLAPLTVTAHTPAWTIPTYAYVACSPNTVGVGQSAIIVMWLDKYPPTAGGLGGDRWRGFKLDITKPDGSKETIPYTGTTSQVGSAWILYTPDQVGDYTIVFSWPGQTLTNGTGAPNLAGLEYVGDYFMGATSAPAILHVTREKIAEWQEAQLPTTYWTRPVNVANREWSQLVSNWLKGSQFRYTNFQEYGKAPDTPHIMWAVPISEGGIADARWYGQIYGTMDYEFPWSWSSPIVMNGKVFLNAAVYPKYGYRCLDLRTGEQLWYKNGSDNGLGNIVVEQRWSGLGGAGVYSGQTFPQLSFGQLYHWYGVNGQGIVTYLWITQTISGSTYWHMIDATTGNWIMSLKNVPGGTSVTDQDGSLLLYSYSATTGRYLCWNVSQSVGPPAPVGTGQQQWKPRVGAVLDAVNDTSWTEWGPITTGLQQITLDDIRPRSGYTMNVTGPRGLPSTITILQDARNVPRLIVHSYFSALPRFGSSEQRFQIAVVRIDEHVEPYSPKPDGTPTQNYNLGFNVTLLWNKNFTYPAGGNMTWNLGPISYEDKVFTIRAKETMQWWGYSLDDGSPLWGPTASQPAWDMYGMGGNYAYGRLYSCGYSGILFCYDMKTGKLLWNYTAAGIGSESPYGNYPLNVGAIADGKVYLYSTEHSPTQPLWRGSYLRCVDAYTGRELWKILIWNMGLALGDGYLVAGNMYDTQLYCIGRGPSATTVTAPDIAVPLGSSIVIRGTVTDQSAGAKNLVQKGLFTTVPAIADEYMEAWMEYLYMQQAIPGDAKGVPVKLQAVGSDGNVIDIGTATTDLSGLYTYMWTPPSTGIYKIVAAFEGTKAYYPSYAETSVGVTTAPAPSVPATSPPASPSPSATEASPTVAPPTGGAPGIDVFMVAAAVIVIAVIIGAALVLRRRTK